MTNQEIVEAVNKYQNSDSIHHLTCGTNSNHDKLVPVEVNEKVVLKCINCNYEQTYIPEFILGS